MRYQTTIIVFLLGAAAAVAEKPTQKEEPTREQMLLPLQELLYNADKEYKYLVADWMISIGRQHLDEKRVRDQLKQDAQFRQAFQNYLVTCCEFAFTPAREKMNFPSVKEGNPGWAAVILLLQVPRDILLAAIVPELDPGKRLDGILERPDRDLAQYLEFQADIAAPVSFQAYMNYLRDHKSKPPEGLIAYMVRRCPGKAISCLVDVFSDAIRDAKQILWAEHVVSDFVFRRQFDKPTDHVQHDALAEIARLAKHPMWWVRLYVAEIMRQHKGLRQKEIIERLKQDKHPLVRETIAAFTKKA